VSSILIFILAALAERGPMHGHQLRLLAEEELSETLPKIISGEHIGEDEA
jgi:hypothetical protein